MLLLVAEAKRCRSDHFYFSMALSAKLRKGKVMDIISLQFSSLLVLHVVTLVFFLPAPLSAAPAVAVRSSQRDAKLARSPSRPSSEECQDLLAVLTRHKSGERYVTMTSTDCMAVPAAASSSAEAARSRRSAHRRYDIGPSHDSLWDAGDSEDYGDRGIPHDEYDDDREDDIEEDDNEIEDNRTELDDDAKSDEGENIENAARPGWQETPFFQRVLESMKRTCQPGSRTISVSASALLSACHTRVCVELQRCLPFSYEKFCLACSRSEEGKDTPVSKAPAALATEPSPVTMKPTTAQLSPPQAVVQPDGPGERSGIALPEENGDLDGIETDGGDNEYGSEDNDDEEDFDSERYSDSDDDADHDADTEGEQGRSDTAAYDNAGAEEDELSDDGLDDDDDGELFPASMQDGGGILNMFGQTDAGRQLESARQHDSVQQLNQLLSAQQQWQQERSAPLQVRNSNPDLEYNAEAS